MGDPIASRIESSVSTGGLYKSNLPSKLKTYGFAIAIIIGIGGLVVGGIGVAGYLGTISNLNQVYALIMMAGGGGGTALFIAGVVGTIKACGEKYGRGVSSEHQAEVIEKTDAVEIQGVQYFGKAKWETYFGDVGTEPPLPGNLDEILNSQCPFFSGKKVKETHMLVLIPKTVNGEGLTLNNLQNLVQAPKIGDRRTDYEYYGHIIRQNHGNIGVSESHWVLMTRDVVPGSRNTAYEKQKCLVEKKEGYRLPGALEVAVCIFTEYVFSGLQLFGDDPLTYTRCAEIVQENSPAAVGGFVSKGLTVFNRGFVSDSYGVAALRNIMVPKKNG